MATRAIFLNFKIFKFYSAKLNILCFTIWLIERSFLIFKLNVSYFTIWLPFNIINVPIYTSTLVQCKRLLIRIRPAEKTCSVAWFIIRSIDISGICVWRCTKRFRFKTLIAPLYSLSWSLLNFITCLSMQALVTSISLTNRFTYMHISVLTRDADIPSTVHR